MLHGRINNFLKTLRTLRELQPTWPRLLKECLHIRFVHTQYAEVHDEVAHIYV